MKKKFVMIGVTCVFMMIAGICYSAYHARSASAVLVTSLTDSGKKETAEQNTHQQYSEDSNPTPGGELKIETKDTNSTGTAIYIHICGAVKNPGVYQVGNGARLIEMIELAGGLSKEAAGDYINQAQPLTDGERIYIPTREEVNMLGVTEYIGGDSKEQEDPSEETALININEADKEELMNLPGIGEAKAKNIIDFRKENGDFGKPEDIMNIPGIKEGLFNQISSYITVK